MDPRETCVPVNLSRLASLTVPDFCSGLWEKRHLVCCFSPYTQPNLFVRQLLRHRRHYGSLRNWISYHGLLLLRFQGSQ
jgi:hypothetical protein